MKIHRRSLAHLAVGAAALPFVPGMARAQAYPSRPARIVVGFPAGGATDIQGRLMGEWLTDRLGQQFIVENKPGASGNIGTETVAKAAPDGYTLLQIVTPHAINAGALFQSQFRLHARHRAGHLLRAAGLRRRGEPVGSRRTTLPELIAYAKANPGKINYGSAGQGTPQNIACELFKMMTGVNLVHVPYKGGAPAVADLISGHVQVIFAPLSESIQQVKAGKLRALAVTTTTPPRGAAGRAAGGGLRAGLRGQRLCGHRRAQGHAGRDHQFAEQGTECRPRQQQGQDPDRRTGRHGRWVARPPSSGRFSAEATEKWAKVIKVAGIKAE